MKSRLSDGTRASAPAAVTPSAAAKTDKYNIKVVERCLEILDYCASADEPITAQSTARHLGVNTNMAFRMLATITAAGYLVKDEKNGQFSVSLKVLQLSRKALNSLEIRRIVMPYLDMLRHKYPKANLNLGVFHQDEVLVVDRIDSTGMPRTYFTPGKSLPFHATAQGKVLASELPEADLDVLIARKGLKAYTPTTIIDAAALKAELARVRREGFARDREESIANDNCNAVPIRDASGGIIATISMSAFDNYMTVAELEEAIPTLVETGRNISYTMGFNS